MDNKIFDINIDELFKDSPDLLAELKASMEMKSEVINFDPPEHFKESENLETFQKLKKNLEAKVNNKEAAPTEKPFDITEETKNITVGTLSDDFYIDDSDISEYFKDDPEFWAELQATLESNSTPSPEEQNLSDWIQKNKQDVEKLKKDVEELKEKVQDKGEKVPPKKKRQLRPVRIISNILFYAAIVIAVIAAFLYSGGYSYFTVLTTSMQGELPKGSLVVTKRADPNTIEIGDNITYVSEDNTIITHKVVDIFENYQESGERGFQTQGVENPRPDKNIVQAANIVGVVIFHIAGIGTLLTVFKDNLWLVFLIFGILIILSFSLRIFFDIRKKEKLEKTVKNPHG